MNRLANVTDGGPFSLRYGSLFTLSTSSHAANLRAVSTTLVLAMPHSELLSCFQALNTFIIGNIVPNAVTINKHERHPNNPAQMSEPWRML